MIGFLAKGIDLQDSRLTRDWRIWVEYFCWCVGFWMMCHHPHLPMRVRMRVLQWFPQERWNVQWHMWDFWVRQGIDLSNAPKPLPWPVCPHGLGPFAVPWTRIARWFQRRTGGRSHRCEFTDPEHGALYGGTDGAFMDRLFERFIENISDES